MLSLLFVLSLVASNSLPSYCSSVSFVDKRNAIAILVDVPTPFSPLLFAVLPFRSGTIV